ncbi:MULTISPECIES: hypothetical protein [unclassified Streptomyces]|uniref:hypothetical protein n=1 Tax=unclassified Streptomyces TaxID=2593676 RepID=UPI000966C0C7|nr:hypothetical protein [Streptomyces sp. TSRI0281]OKI32237.1 hypothetical protein A6A29_22175 [Streptomyces sp. TSRI0281]
MEFLVVNAGITHAGPVTGMRDEQFRGVFLWTADSTLTSFSHLLAVTPGRLMSVVMGAEHYSGISPR